MKLKTKNGASNPASDVISPAANVPIQSKWRRFHARLLQLRAQVLRDTGELSSEAAEATALVSMHPADAASDSFDRDLALGLLAFEQNALGEIDEALRRIRDGSYDVCALTGKPIPRQRLEAIPWTRYTKEAQAELERRGEAQHAHLNELKSARPEHQRSK